MSSRPVSETVRCHFRSVVFSCGVLCLPLTGRAQSLSGSPASDPLLSGTPSAVAAPVGSTEKNAFQAISREVQAIFNKSKDAVVRIEATDAYGPHDGTGFFIDPAGTIYTHYSVAGRSWNLLVEFAGKKYPATCLLADPRSGVTLLNIHAGQTPFLPIGRSSDLKMASAVVAIGYPMDQPESATFGLVSGFDQKFFDRYLPMMHIRSNVPVQDGESGAPLLNASGEVVGILMCKLDFGAVCLSIPIRAAEKVRTDYLRFGTIRPGWIGVNAKPVIDNDEESEMRVDRLAEGSPACDCGLEVGDTLLRVGNTPIRRLADLLDASFYLTAGEMVPIAVERGGKGLTVNARAADLPGESMSLPPVRENEPGSPTLTLPISRGAR